MYFIILWWNDARISKIIVQKCWKILILIYFIILWWNDVRISKTIVEIFWKIMILLYSIILWWKVVRISKITVEKEKVYFRSQILECPSIGEYWNIFGVPVLPENVIFMFYRTCWCYSEAYNTGTQKWSSIVQCSCTSIWDLKFTFSDFNSYYYFVMKWCEDFKHHFCKFWKGLIFMYSFYYYGEMMWGFLKSLSKNLEKC